jgi:hypothetical protein
VRGKPDAAARVAEIGRAGRAEHAPALLVEAMHEAADLGDERAVLAANLADRSGIEKNPLLDVRPVDEPGLEARIVEAAGGDVVLGEAGGDECARDFAAADRKAEFPAGLGGFEPGPRREDDAAEGEVAIVVGEARDRTVAAGELPAMAQRRDLAREVRGKALREGSHGGSSDRCTAPQPGRARRWSIFR